MHWTSQGSDPPHELRSHSSSSKLTTIRRTRSATWRIRWSTRMSSICQTKIGPLNKVSDALSKLKFYEECPWLALIFVYSHVALRLSREAFLIIILFPLFKEKRDDRRKRINRPKRSVCFALENNKTQEFKKMDIVQRDDRVIKSKERNVPKTPGRLVKLN